MSYRGSISRCGRADPGSIPGTSIFWISSKFAKKFILFLEWPSFKNVYNGFDSINVYNGLHLKMFTRTCLFLAI